MAKNIQLASDQNTIHWPNACAYCCRKDPTQSVLAGIAKDTSSLIDAAVGVTAYSTVGIKYPVCREHASIAQLSTWLTRKSILPTLVRWYGFLLGVPAAILFALKLLVWLAGIFVSSVPNKQYSHQADEPIFFVLISLGAILALALTLLSFAKVPVRLTRLDEDSLTLRIANERYARHFVAANKND